jgi:hypothetical protein
MWYRPTQVLLALSLGATGCSLDVSFSESRYACARPSLACPLGYSCSERGFCEVGTPSPFLDGAIDSGDDQPSDDASDEPSDDSSDGDGDGGDDTSDEADAAVVDAARPDAEVIDAALPDAPRPDADTGPFTVSIVASRDTRLHGGERHLNFGATGELVCNGNPDTPVLIGWNLSAIPSSATVDSAVMRLSTGDNALQGESASVFALLEDWNEGNQNGAAGAASYDQRKPGTSWLSAGARPPSRTTSPVVVFAPTQANQTFQVNLPTALVQTWVDLPAGNFGVVITCPFSNDVAFHSRSVAGKQPVLVVTYHL